MDVIQSQKNLINDVGRHLFIKLFKIDDTVEQLASLYEFRYDVEIAIVFEKLENSHDVRVRRLLQNFKLVHHQFKVDIVALELFLVDALNRANKSCLDVDALVDKAESALA